MEAPDGEGSRASGWRRLTGDRRPGRSRMWRAGVRTLAQVAKSFSDTRRVLRVCVPCSAGRDRTAQGAGAASLSSEWCLAGGQWIEAWAPLPGNTSATVQMFPLRGGSPVVIGSNTGCSGRAAETLCGSPPEQLPMAGLISFPCRRQDIAKDTAGGFDSSRKSPVCPERI